MKALREIQHDLKAPKGQYNSFGKYKYRSTEDILEALKPHLKKHYCELILRDEVKQVGDLTFIECTATISDGQEYRAATAQAGIDPSTKGMSLAQCFGASSSYARKYALSGLFCLDDQKDADATNTHGKAEKQPKTAGQTTTAGRPCTKDDVKFFYNTMNDAGLWEFIPAESRENLKVNPSWAMFEAMEKAAKMAKAKAEKEGEA